MDYEIYGGNIVRNLTGELDSFSDGRFDLVSGAPYEYFMLKIRAESAYDVKGLGSFTVFVLNKESRTTIKISGLSGDVAEGDAVQCEGVAATLSVHGGTATLLVAGTAEEASKHPAIMHTSSKDIYKVTKPWGHELWINGQHPTYAIKQIFIKDKTKTSLQFHNFKQETNILFAGDARLHFNTAQDKPNLDVNEADVGNILLSAVSSIDVKPPTLHRLEAVGDILLYEVSTAHLDDVVRVMDDTKRPDGRLEKEHGA